MCPTTVPTQWSCDSHSGHVIYHTVVMWCDWLPSSCGICRKRTGGRSLSSVYCLYSCRKGWSGSRIMSRALIGAYTQHSLIYPLTMEMSAGLSAQRDNMAARASNSRGCPPTLPKWRLMFVTSCFLCVCGRVCGRGVGVYVCVCECMCVYVDECVYLCMWGEW